MRYISLFSGIEAASIAWKPLGWTPVAFSEINKFASAVLKYRYPEIPNVGDITQHDWSQYRGTVDLVIGGSPCQSFSVAGLRKGLDDPRGNLMLNYLKAVDGIKPRWLVWENVFGVLSIDKGRAFGALLGGLEKLGYGFAYRVLDVQHIRTRRFMRAIPQRRRRVFVIGYFGDWRPPAAVLFDTESLRGNPPPRRETGEDVAGDAGEGFTIHGTDKSKKVASHADTSTCLRTRPPGSIENNSTTVVTYTLNSHHSSANADETFVIQDANRAGGERKQNGLGIGSDVMYTVQSGNEHGVAHTIRAEGFDASEDGTGRGTPLVPMVANCLTTNYGKQPDSSNTSRPPNLIGFSSKDHGGDASEDVATTVRSMNHDKSHANGGGDKQHVMTEMMVRRLTPREVERLFGLPDDYTLVAYPIKPAKDGPRYAALGNSIGVNCLEWIGQRIMGVDEILTDIAVGKKP